MDRLLDMAQVRAGRVPGMRIHAATEGQSLVL
jgi:hypothetical protein